MKKHFSIQLAGSAVCLFFMMKATSSRVIGGDAAGAIANTANILDALQWFGTYLVFSVVVLGHGLLCKPVRAGGSDSPDKP
jgi:hypothetical protein